MQPFRQGDAVVLHTHIGRCDIELDSVAFVRIVGTSNIAKVLVERGVVALLRYLY
jgi:hypothetical protein